MEYQKNKPASYATCQLNAPDAVRFVRNHARDKTAASHSESTKGSDGIHG